MGARQGAESGGCVMALCPWCHLDYPGIPDNPDWIDASGRCWNCQIPPRQVPLYGDPGPPNEPPDSAPVSEYGFVVWVRATSRENAYAMLKTVSQIVSIADYEQVPAGLARGRKDERSRGVPSSTVPRADRPGRFAQKWTPHGH